MIELLGVQLNTEEMTEEELKSACTNCCKVLAKLKYELLLKQKAKRNYSSD